MRRRRRRRSRTPARSRVARADLGKPDPLVTFGAADIAFLERYTHHRAGSPGRACVACHMPGIQQTCTLCHADRTPARAADALRTWDSASPWRVAP